MDQQLAWATLPLLLSFFPLVSVMVVGITDPTNSQLALVMPTVTYAFTCMPSVSPLLPMLLIKPYRKRLLGIFAGLRDQVARLRSRVSDSSY